MLSNKCLIRGQLNQTFPLTRQQFPEAINIFLVKAIASERQNNKENYLTSQAKTDTRINGY
jgi:hypothetical protein